MRVEGQRESNRIEIKCKFPRDFIALIIKNTHYKVRPKKKWTVESDTKT